MALGGAQSNVGWMVMKEVLGLVASGIGIGLPVAWALTDLVKSHLYGITPSDPVSIVLATTGIAVVSLLAGYLPAVRATRVDPLKALLAGVIASRPTG